MSKIIHPKCPKCGKDMRIIPPIHMAVCDDCNQKYYTERLDDGTWIVLGDYYAVKAEKAKEKVGAKEKKAEPEIPDKKPEENPTEEPTEKPNSPEKEEPEQKPTESHADTVDITISDDMPVMIPHPDTRIDDYQKYVDQYVNKRYWIQIAKEELKNMVAELYDAGALGNSFNPERVAKRLLDMNDKTILKFYGVDWLDRAATKELLTRIWLKLQGYKEIIKMEKLKYYIAIFHPEEVEDFINGKLAEIKVKKYLYEMEAIDR